MEPVAADLLEVLEAVEPSAHRDQPLGVALVVDRIGLRHALDVAALDRPWAGQPEPAELGGRQLDEALVAVSQRSSPSKQKYSRPMQVVPFAGTIHGLHER